MVLRVTPRPCMHACYNHAIIVLLMEMRFCMEVAQVELCRQYILLSRALPIQSSGCQGALPVVLPVVLPAVLHALL